MFDEQIDPALADLFECFRLMKSLIQTVVAEQDLSSTHLRALRVLSEEPGCTMKRLTDVLEVAPGTSTGVIDRLCSLGFVCRSQAPGDRRIVRVELTPEGLATTQKLTEGIRRRFDVMVETLDPEAKQRMTEGIHLMAETFKRSGL